MMRSILAMGAMVLALTASLAIAKGALKKALKTNSLQKTFIALNSFIGCSSAAYKG
jgi:hypothetical protein